MGTTIPTTIMHNAVNMTFAMKTYLGDGPS